MRILVTNDDGIDSVGMRRMAAALASVGEVVVVAPDSEYSGASAAVGPLHLVRTDAHEAVIEGVPQAFAVTGPPGLCVYLAALGAFGRRPDLVVSGINPGANVGRAVYHSGTVGAALTARNHGIPGIAVSQAVTGWGVEGQGWDDLLTAQRWDTAVTVARVATAAMLAQLPAEPLVLNVNVPNCELDEIRGWRYCEIGRLPARALSSAWLEPKAGHTGSYRVRMRYGDAIALPADVDGGAVEQGYVSLSWLGRTEHHPAGHDPIEHALTTLLRSPTAR